MSRIGNRIAPAWLLTLVAAVWMLPSPALAQLDDLLSLGGSSSALSQAEVVQVQAVFTAPAADQPAMLYVVAEMQPGWHIYSLTQGKGGPIASAIRLDDDQPAKLAGPWKALPQPKSKLLPELYQDLAIESHENRVVWQAPLEFAATVDPAALKLKTTVKVQACNDKSCLPPKNYPVVAQLGPRPELPPEHKVPAATARVQPTADDQVEPPVLGIWEVSGSHTTLRGEFSPSVAIPGGTVELRLTAIPAADYHVYGWAPVPTQDPTAKPAMLVIDGPREAAAGWQISHPVADARLISAPDTPPYYDGAVTWTIELTVPADAQIGSETLVSGLIGYQSCSDRTCDRPLGARFEFMLPIRSEPVPATAPVAFTKASYADAARASSTWNDPTAVAASGVTSISQIQSIDLGQGGLAGLPLQLLTALLGGFILNFMPCVLPVIGLKVLAFVQQAGDSRRRVFMLNLWYSLGLISVFVVLAALVSIYSLAWGQQFSDANFMIVLTAIVFAMALSFLGVWEIPIPGFAASSKANAAADREGPLGAFLKGGITTLLATPCVGPMMGGAVGWALAQSPAYIFVIFTCIGLGMASPFLLIGVYPRLIRFLPKPGMWMETFKELMGFILLGTVIFLLSVFPKIAPESIIPTIALLFGIWAACWWFGKTPLTAELGARMRAWIGAVAILLVVSGFSFGWLHNVMTTRHNAMIDDTIAKRLSGDYQAAVETEGNELPWQPYSEKKFLSLLNAGHTVMVDFTADWCTNCKFLERTVLNTAPTKQLVSEGGVVPLVADMTNWSEAEGRELLSQLVGGNGQIPVLAIFPADRPDQPIIFNEMYLRETLLAALREAGPSKSNGQPATQSAGTLPAEPPIARTAMNAEESAGR